MKQISKGRCGLEKVKKSQNKLKLNRYTIAALKLIIKILTWKADKHDTEEAKSIY